MPVSNANPSFLENDNNPNDNVGLPAGTKGYVTSLPANPLFSFKANGLFTYNTDYLLPLWVDPTTWELSASDGGGDTELSKGFDSLSLGSVVYDSFDVTYTTGEGTVTETITVTITGVNDDPTAVDDLYGSVIDNDSGAVFIDVMANDFDVDEYDNETTNDADTDGDTFEVSGVTQATHGTVTWDASGVYYDPDAGYIGTDSFTYTITDQWGGTDTATVTVVVGPTNNPPTAVDDTPANGVTYGVMEEDGSTVLGSVLDNDSDPDGDVLGALLLSSPELYYSDVDGNALANGNATGTGTLELHADGTFSYDAGGNFDYLAAGQQAYVAFHYLAFDGDLIDGEPPDSADDAVAVIVITGENDDPTANPAEETVYEAGLSDGSGVGTTTTIVSGMISASDVDLTDVLTITHVDGAEVTDGIFETDAYKLTVNGLNYTYELKDNRTDHSTQGMNADGITDVFALTIGDGNGGSVVVNLTVNVVDDQPVVADDFTLGSITHDETPGVGDSGAADDIGANTAQVTGLMDLSSIVVAGADGIQSQSVALTDAAGDPFAGTETNLTDTASGNTIFLFDDGSGGVIGRVGNDDGTANIAGAVAFTLALSIQPDDTVDALLTQNRAIVHGDASNPNDTVTLQDAAGIGDLLHVKVEVDDGDTNATDTVSAVSIDTLTVSFIDDAPALTAEESGFVNFAVSTSEGAASGLDFGFDGAGYVDLTSYTTSVAVYDLDGVLNMTLTGSEGPDNTVTYSANGVDYFQLVLDGATGNYTMEVLNSAPPITNQVDFSAVGAGSPQGVYYFPTLNSSTVVGFNAFANVHDPADNAAGVTDVKDAFSAPGVNPNLTVNPSEQGFGGGNNNTDPGEGYYITATDGMGGDVDTSGVVFDVGKATGGIKSVQFKWEAYDDGVLVAEGTEPLASVPKPGATDATVTIALDGVEADTFYILPEIESNKGAFAITKLSILEAGGLDDFAFDFTAAAYDADGDSTGDVSWTVGVDGSSDGYAGLPALDLL